MLLRGILRNRATARSVRHFSGISRDKYYNLLQLDDTRQELRETFEKFAQEECAPLAEEMDKTMVFPHEMWQKFGDMGMLGLTVEEEYGGMGLGYFEHCIAVEEVSKANAGMALSYLAHSNLCVN
jgi:isovaleryl-CoA dehydrogenase